MEFSHVVQNETNRSPRDNLGRCQKFRKGRLNTPKGVYKDLSGGTRQKLSRPDYTRKQFKHEGFNLD